MATLQLSLSAVVFNSYTFVVFLVIVLAVYYLPLAWRWKKLHLLLASYVFYAAWNPPFVALLWLSTLVDWFAAKGMHRFDKAAVRRALLFVSLGTNLGLLAIFKYGDFLLENFQALLARVNVVYQPPALDIVLPVGISFYTFQTLSYTIDVYRRKTKPCSSLLDFSLYVTFFPQLVAGPIVRAVDFLPQCREPRAASARQFGWGLSLLALGLFQKCVLADGFFAPISDKLYQATASPDFSSAWYGTLAFAGQIFCDFAGYSSCAIGVAMCLGFALPDNFRAPYAAIGFSDFWRRWHISLSSWLRDYLYVPLGGSRKGKRRTYGNLMATMLIGGLWHGHSWAFVFWGGLHGTYLAVERSLKRATESAHWLRSSSLRIPLALATFALVCFTWVFFRADSFSNAFIISGAMLGITSDTARHLFTFGELFQTMTLVALLLLAHLVMRDVPLESIVDRMPWWCRSAVVAMLLAAIIMTPGENHAFIYFQF
jgi:D-alanyl-lipoteichoic acid acyltransferase DltB (MBOAT superfamily)